MLTRDFWLLNASSTLFMMSFSMILPELPEFLIGMGGEQYIGYIVGLFTITAGLSRLWSGQLADRIGRIKIILFGTVVTALCGFLYIFAVSIQIFMIIRLIHGMSTGWRPVGATALLTDIVPIHRRGEAMGYLGIAGSTGMALGPAIGSLLKEEISFDAMFIASSLIGIVSLVLSLKIKESLKNPQKIVWSDLNIFKGKILDISAYAASIVTLFETFSFGVVITLSPILVDHLGFQYKGLFNLTFVSASVFMRVIAGKASDKYGREPLLIIGLVFLIIAMFLLGNADTRLMVVSGGIIYGLSIGINRPTIFAWTVDLANPKKLAVSLATMLLALEIGIGAGAFIGGSMYQGEIANISRAFNLASIGAIIALSFLVIRRFLPKKASPTH
jgi:MFS family permease